MLACMLDGGDHSWVLSAVALFIPLLVWVSFNTRRMWEWIKRIIK